MTNLAWATKVAGRPASGNAFPFSLRRGVMAAYGSSTGQSWVCAFTSLIVRKPKLGAAKPLPNEWQEAVLHLRLIVRVARKVLSQEPFLIEQSPDQDRQDEEKCEEAPPAAKGKRYADEHDERARIHRMPHKRIRTRRDDRLAFGDLNRGRAVGVFPQYKECEQKPQRDQDIPEYRHVPRHR